MIRLTRAAPLLALLTASCSDELDTARVVPLTPTVDLCSGLPPLALTVEPARVRVSTPVSLAASGGSGHYRFLLEPGGSSGEVVGNRFVAGRTPATDTLVVEDAKCPGDARASVTVVAAFDVAPARAELPPGTSFQVAVDGLLGSPSYTLTRSGSGGTLTEDGVYTAGTRDGTDLLTVRDSRTGDEALLQYEVRTGARLLGDPAYLAVPSGSSVPLATRGGADRVTWTKVSGPGTLANGRISFAPGDTGVALLSVTDPFTKQTAQVSVRVLTELTRPGLAHGRLTDVASMVTADFDGDGTLDLAVGQRESDLSRPSGGAVFIFKGGPDGLPAEPTWVLTGSTDTAAFGDVLAAGDLDRDGRAELVVSSPGADVAISNAGAVYLYTFKGGTPAPLRQQLTGLLRDAAFGAGLAIADVDGDGDLDLVAGAPAGDLSPTTAINKRGTVDIYLSEPSSPVPDLPTMRLGGSDLSRDGALLSRSSSDLGRAVVVADLNADGRVDLAALGRITRWKDDGTADGSQVAVSVFFARADGSRFRASPDVYVLPGNTGDTTEGTWRLAAIPGEGARPPLLMAVADGLNSPDLRSSGGVQSGGDSGGALLFDLSDRKPTGEPPGTPPRVTLEEAFARIYGDAGGINAGRSWAVMDVDGVPGPELLLGAPKASGPGANNALRWSGKVLVYPLATLTKGAVLNKPLVSLVGPGKSDTLGSGLATWNLPGGEALVAFSGRASSEQGAFTGRVELYRRAGASLTEWTRTSARVPAKPSVERYGEVVAMALGPQGPVTLVGAPGWSGAGSNNDGDALSIGRAYVYDATKPTASLVAEQGAPSPSRAGRGVGADVAFTDFNGDGRPDMAVGATSFYVPGTTNSTAELESTYAGLPAGCATTGSQTLGGVLVSLGQTDGTFKPAYRLWAPPAQIPNCTPETDSRCKRTSVGRGLVGGFDFNNDGKEDLGVLRDKGFELYLGRTPQDASLAKLTASCTPDYTWPTMELQTSVPASLGDLNGDNCDEVAWRYAEGTRSGVAILFGYDASGARCGSRTTPTVLRLAGDSEKNLANLGLGVAITRAGRFLNDTRDFVAISASSIPFGGVTQPVVLLYDKAELLTKMQSLQTAGQPLVIGALSDGVTPVTLVHRTRAVSFGASLAGGRDLTGDNVPDLLVGAPGASDASDGGGAVFLYAGGRDKVGALSPFLMVVGDGSERGALGQDVALMPGGGATPPMLLVGAPRSYRSGTQNGTAFVLPLGF
ncbi:VCBS repeat-containing protein [Pyxidicoccus fallax]|uniref:VCBS repeat-containing protein n=1 Tax=Pyxidicoccus fallax TaxID=394095 RepID=A0A848LC73_9BACT|nr:VCBS repeat-containing protein [Pyxidicoccus fallax]NMO16074.1 VCBS repeat-containing protein [Pyxidicoccus fallax]NPC81782.1 VCBS repeat-containing protein [Pyxidicoccus fallax]